MGIKGGNMKLNFFSNFLSKKDKNDEIEKEKENEKQLLLQKREEEIEMLTKDVVWLKRLLSHNFRMPMAIISGYGELLKNGEFKDREEEINCINKICSNIDYLATISKIILDDDNEELLLDKEYFDILKCIQEVSLYVKTIVQKAGIVLSVNSSKDEILFYGNRITIMRAFFNLVENSIKYMNNKGNITITIEETDEELLIVYRDNGEGMDPEEAKHITEINYQGSNRKAGSYGIGMYLVGKAIEDNGGTIQVKTEKGFGMCIYMSFQKKL